MNNQNKPFRIEFYTTRRGDSPTMKEMKRTPKTRQDIIAATIKLLAIKRGKPEGIDIKKAVNGVWRLRSGDYRVLYGIVKETIVVLAVFRKKAQRLEARELRKAINHFEDYIERIINK